MRTDFRPVSPQRPPRLTIQGIRSYVNNPSNISVETKSLFARSGYGVLRLLTREGDIRLLSDYLKIAPVEPDLCRRFLTEENPSDLNTRVLLLQASAGQSCCESDPLFSETEDAYSSYKKTCRRIAAKDPFLRIPLATMNYRQTRQLNDCGTDGTSFYIHPDRDMPLTAEEIQHMVIHCMFGHLRIPKDSNSVLWDISVDLAAEYLRTRIFPENAGSGQPRTYESLAPILSTFPRSLYPGSAPAVYRQLAENFSNDELKLLQQQLRHDDHSIWRRPSEKPGPTGGDGTEGESGTDRPSAEKMEKLWQEAFSQLRHKTRSSRRGIAPGSHEEQILLREQAAHDFRRYLRRFAEIREELQLDMESFDPIPYHYGLRTYGNMPLIEPPETTDAFKVEQLAIAIDTSGSCDTLMVQNFLTEVHRILTCRENFFRHMEVHILQCDSVIHEHVVIHSTEEWMHYVQNITIRGRGGTDFTPVFQFFDKLQAEGKCRRLKGLLYFTDGDGIYPDEAPPYETAFVFSRKDYMQYQPPAWCIKLCTDDAEERF